jgi:uncharacterized phage protein (TIGR01671 family)
VVTEKGDFMNREILFRGKRIDNGKWVYGSYLFLNVPSHDWTGRERGKPSEVHFIVDEHDINFAVDPATVGQFTGLTDKNGKKIFEGDILKTHYANAPKADFVEQVVFHGGKFCAEGSTRGNYKCWEPLADGIKHIPQDKSVYMESCEIIGNIYDNPELLAHAN